MEKGNSHLQEQLPTAPHPPHPVQPPADPGHPPTVPAQNDLCIIPIRADSHLIHVLRLSPGPTAPPTPFDIILPPAATQAQYPKFTPANCGWHAIFECIAQPALLWDCWGPGSLGEYPDVLTLWKSWDKGMRVEGVGQRPPLRLVDARWGCHRDVRSQKGHLPAWRPRNNDNARRIWSQYQFFTRCIEESIAHGGTALQAIHDLDDQRGSRSLPQLHRELQPKGRKKKAPAAPNATAAAGPGSTGDGQSRVGGSPPPGEG
ncbi:hypothetical protein EI94DRAFT_1773821 [Lactarius quietus]|nr:hypothetical protein EI94DRAFT_1773821 [Lactarius quietus]